MKNLLFITVFSIYGCLNAQEISQEILNQTAMDFGQQSFSTFFELLSLPNDAHFPKDIEKNIQWCEKNFQSRAFSTKRLDTGGIPLLLAEKKVPDAQKTVLIYLQLDGQPVDPTKWFQQHPFKPALKELKGGINWEEIPWSSLEENYNPEWRIFARSASDAKGPVSMFIAALDAIKKLEKSPNFNIKVIMDFEEELGSPRLPAAVETHQEALKSDMLIIFDGPRHISNLPTLTFGARGIATMTLTVYGPKVPQHSGHYGNYAPNPGVRLAQLIASMKDEAGRVTIPGYYDGIELDEATKAILDQVPDNEAEIMRSIGISETDKVGKTYQEAIQYPSLNVRGLSSGWIGSKVRTIVPATATAEIDIRIVPESDPERLIQLIKNHIKSKGYYIVNKEPTEEERVNYSKIAFVRHSVSYQAFRTDFNSEVGLWLDKALSRHLLIQSFWTTNSPIKIRRPLSGGSIPIAPFVNSLGIPAVTYVPRPLTVSTYLYVS